MSAPIGTYPAANTKPPITAPNTKPPIIGPVANPAPLLPETHDTPIGPNPAKPGETGPAKTPVSKLYELATVLGLEINFEVESETGQSHNKIFVMKVTVGDIVSCQGKGSNKKLAKHDASSEALTKLMETPAFHSYLQGKRSIARNPSIENAVGKLQESTTKRGLIKPTYNVLKDEGPPHKKNFETECVLGVLRCTGNGRTKKEAKRNAAKAMLDQITKSNLSFQTPAKKMMFVPPSTANQTLSSTSNPFSLAPGQ